MNTDTPATWIFLRGLAREVGHWGTFLEDFSKARPDDEVLALDLPGTGEFYQSAAPRSMRETFNFVRAQAITRTRGAGRFHLVALSLGGMIAMEWMRQNAAELDRVVLINTSANHLSPFYYRLRWQIWAPILKLISVQSARTREREILKLLVNRPEVLEAALPAWTKIAMERPISHLNFVNQLYAAARFSGFEKAPAVPILILSSLGDRLVDPSCSTQLHEKFGWPIVRHPWAGHDVPWDDPQWVIDKILCDESRVPRPESRG